MKSDLKKLIEEIQNTSPLENLSAIVGKNLGDKLKKLIEEAEKADEELNILHKYMTKMYEFDSTYPLVKECLSEIDKIK